MFNACLILTAHCGQKKKRIPACIQSSHCKHTFFFSFFLLSKKKKMERPQTLSIDNFIIERNIESFVTRKPKATKRRRQSLNGQVNVPNVIVATGLAQVLTKYVIYIDERASYFDRLVAIARGMGGTLASSSDTSNLVIVEPRMADRHKMSARYQRKGLKCAPPAWLFTCYEENRHIPIAHFPFDIKQNQLTFNAIPVVEDDNPFGLDPVDYDDLEENMPGRQTTMDRYLTETITPEQEYPHHQEEEIEEEENEQEEMEQEFYYNRRQETPEESQERKRAAAERMKNLLLDAENTIRNKNNIARRAKKVERKIASHVEEDRTEMKVWYGEQSIINTTKRSRK